MNDEKVINYILNNYAVIKKTFNKEQVRKFWTVYKDKNIVISEENKIKGIGIYLRLDDETFNLVRLKEIFLNNPETLNFCACQNGQNIHFIMVIADNTKTILKGLKQIFKMENIKTISWFSPNMKQFFMRKKERILCHQPL